MYILACKCLLTCAFNQKNLNFMKLFINKYETRCKRVYRFAIPAGDTK